MMNTLNDLIFKKGFDYMINKFDDTPAYKQLRNIIKTRIAEGVYPVDKIMPGENDLSKEFNVSRVTVRSALALLEQDGYIKRRPGYGTYVCFSDPGLNKFTFLKSFTSEMQEMGHKSITLHAELSVIEADNLLATIFNCATGDQVYLLRRLRGDEQAPFVFSETYLHLNIELPNDNEFLYSSLYAFLIKQGISFIKIKEVIEAELPSNYIREWLKIAKSQSVLKRTRYSYGKNGKVLEYTINYYNANRYKYRIEINSI